MIQMQGVLMKNHICVSTDELSERPQHSECKESSRKINICVLPDELMRHVGAYVRIL